MSVDRLTWEEQFARAFERPARKYPRPGDLAVALDPATRTSPALEALDDALVSLIDDDDHEGLAVLMPPQEGKSQRVSRRFVEWLLAWDSSLRVVDVSYELDLALRWGRDVKLDIATADRKVMDVPIRKDSYAAGRWDTPAGGGMYCVGIGGPLTGRPVDVLIIDDPVKDRADAESERMRQRAWDWWESVALTRLAPGGKVVLIQTRWHQDDLAGRILSRPSPLRWRTLAIPAIAVEGDPLGRAPGAELASVRDRAPGYFARLQATMSHYVFSGVYQQNPTAAEGNFFRRPSFRYWREAEPWPDGRERVWCEGQPVTLADCWKFATVDPAASEKTSADWTVISVWAITVEGDLLLLDRRRKHVADHDHFAMAAPLRARWGFDTLFVEKSWWGKTLIQDAEAAHWPVAPLEADKDKVTRAVPAAGRVHQGKVWFPAVTSGCECGTCPGGVWLDEWCDELAAFPNATDDDQVDTLAYAARVVTARWVPPRTPPRPGPSPAERAVALAARSATGDGDRPLDIMNVPY